MAWRFELSDRSLLPFC